MEPVAIFILLILLVIIILFVTRPFFDRRRVLSDHDSQEASSLMAERERLLTALQELDFDQALGKIPGEDYPVQRAALLQKGAEVLRQLDALLPANKEQDGRKVQPPGTEPQPFVLLSDDDLEDLLAKRRTAHKDKSAGFCPSCGKPVLKSDVFCPSCGSTLKLF
jgi:hypothetical protein